MTDQELCGYIKSYEIAKTKIEKVELIKKISGLKQEQFKYLLQYGSKGDWFVESEILISLGYPFVKPVMNKLFEWMQDLNWPGA
jgi:hypothetical protein